MAEPKPQLPPIDEKNELDEKKEFDEYNSTEKEICKIGEGAYSIITLIKRADGKYLARKQLKVKGVKKNELKHRIKRTIIESKAIMAISSKHVINCLSTKEVVIDGIKVVNMYLELCGWDLCELMAIKRLQFDKLNESKLDEGKEEEITANPNCNLIKLAIFDIVNGLQDLHSRTGGVIVHRDMKPENVLLGNGLFKINDLGISCIGTRPMSTIAGTCTFMAPEVGRKNYTYKCDIWSLGMIICDSFCDDIIEKILDKFANDTDFKIFDAGMFAQEVHNEICNYNNENVKKRFTDETLHALMIHCLKVDAKYRPSATQILKQYFDDYVRPADIVKELKLVYKNYIETITSDKPVHKYDMIVCVCCNVMKKMNKECVCDYCGSQVNGFIMNCENTSHHNNDTYDLCMECCEIRKKKLKEFWKSFLVLQTMKFHK